MADNTLLEVENMDDSNEVTSRPTLAQVKTIVEFMQKHPGLALWKSGYGVSRHSFQKLWMELSNIVNSIHGAMKSTKGWIKFWSDKRRSIVLKRKQIEEGKIQGRLTALEQKIFDLCSFKPTKSKKRREKGQCNGDADESLDNFHTKEEEDDDKLDSLFASENDERYLNIMEKLVDVMGDQATAMAQVAQAQLDHSKALERLAEASHIQALAVDRMASTFETISSSVLDVRNALLGIDYTMKRCCPATTPQRQNSNIFS